MDNTCFAYWLILNSVVTLCTKDSFICINLIENPIFQLCKKHHFGIDKPEKLAQSPDDSKFLMKTLSQIKSNVAVPIKKKVYFFRPSSKPCTTFPVFHTFKSFEVLMGFLFCCFAFSTSFFPFFTHPIQYSPAFQVKENKEKERLERRLLDELYKVFMDSDSFYYSMTYDLTNSVQRQGDSDKSSLPLWKQVWRKNSTMCSIFTSVCCKNILHILIFVKGWWPFLLE